MKKNSIMLWAIGSIIPALFILLHSCQKETPAIAADTLTLSTHFRRYEVVLLNTGSLYTSATDIVQKGTGQLQIVSAEGKIHCTLRAKPNDLFEGPAKALEYGANGTQTAHDLKGIALMGSVSGRDFNEGRIFVTEEFIGGFWTENNDLVYLEPLQLYQKDAPSNQFVIHKASDEIESKDGQSCGTEASVEPSIQQGAAERSSANCWKMEVFCDGDYEYYKNKAGSNWNLAAFAIAVAISNADAKYAAINLDLVIPSGGIGIYTDPNAWWYYPKSANGDILLTQLRDYHNYFHAGTNRDTWVLFTGKNIYSSSAGSGLVGIAYVDVICNNRPYSYAVVEWTSGNTLTNTTAHELGHNLAARHTGEVACPAGTTGGGIMNAIVPSTVASFSSCSNAQMNWHLWFNNGCLTQNICQ